MESSKNNAIDRIYTDPNRTTTPFTFDQSVVDVFDDMISRSVPLYHEVQQVMIRLAIPQLTKNLAIYDLGCSTGATFLHLLPHAQHSPAHFIGVDLSQPMLQQCRKNLDQAGFNNTIELLHANLSSIDLAPASAVFMTYTLQFLDPAQRLDLLKKIRKALQPGGLLLLTEKVHHSDPETQKTLTTLHHDFKRRNGYSDLEISGKRDALMDVLTPLTLEENQAMLQEAGFKRHELLLKWYTFASMAAYS